MDKQKEKQVTILVVEDSPTQMEEMKYTLEKKGYTVISAKNGMKAMEYLSENTPSVIISDIIMPEIDGYELCKRIKSDEKLKSIPVILLTTLSEPEDILKGLDCGADNFLTKPYEEEFLFSRIDYILLNRELRQSSPSDIGIEIVFSGKKQYITSSRMQILDMLISTYEAALQKSRELERANRELRELNNRVKTLSGLIPICSVCKKIRNDQGYWEQLEEYIAEHSEADFSHGYCPDCAAKVLQRIGKDKKSSSTD